MAFDVKGALNAGASEDDIINYLNQTRGGKFDVAGAVQAGASKQDIINHLVNTPAPNSSGAGQSTYQQGRGVLQKIAGFLGIEKAGQATATVLRTPQETNQSGNEAGQSLNDTLKITKMLHSLPADDPRRQHLAEYLKHTMSDPGFTAQSEIDPGTQLSNKEVAGSFANVGLNALGAGEVPGLNPLPEAGALGRIGNKAIQGAALGVAGGAAQAANDNSNLGPSSVIGGVLGALLGGGTQGIAEAGKLLTSPHVTESIYNKALAVPPKVIEKGKSPVPGLIEQGVVGSKQGLLKRAEATIQDSESQVQNILKNSPAKFYSQNVLQQIGDNLQAKFPESLGPDDIKQIIQSLPLNSLKANRELPVAKINALRREIDNNFLNNSKWLNDSSATNTIALKTAANTLRDIVQSTDEKLPGIFSQYADALTTKRALVKDLAKPHALANMIELGGAELASALAGHGFNLDSALKGGLLYGATKAATSAPVMTATAVGLDKAGKAASNPGALQKAARVVGKLVGQAAVRQTSSSVTKSPSQ